MFQKCSIFLIAALGVVGCKTRYLNESATRDIAMGSFKSGSVAYLYYIEQRQVHKARCEDNKPPTRANCREDVVAPMDIREFSDKLDAILARDVRSSPAHSAVLKTEGSIARYEAQLGELDGRIAAGNLDAGEKKMLEQQRTIYKSELDVAKKKLADQKASLPAVAPQITSLKIVNMLMDGVVWDFTLPTAEENLKKAVKVIDVAMGSAGGSEAPAEAQGKWYGEPVRRTGNVSFHFSMAKSLTQVMVPHRIAVLQGGSIAILETSTDGNSNSGKWRRNIRPKAGQFACVVSQVKPYQLPETLTAVFEHRGSSFSEETNESYRGLEKRSLNLTLEGGPYQIKFECGQMLSADNSTFELGESVGVISLRSVTSALGSNANFSAHAIP